MRHLLVSLMSCLLCAQVPPEPARIQVFQATATGVRKGGTVTLRWSVVGADRVRLEPLGQELPARGEITQPVNDRTVFWLHANNLRGGQSVPLVVELLPDDPAFPNLNGIQPPAPVQPPAVPVLLPAPMPALATRPPAAPPKRRAARRAGARPAWIQFAAMVNPRHLRRLQKNLLRAAATQASLWPVTRRSGPPMQLVRSGPYPTVQAARARLRELAPLMASLRLQPIIITHAGRSQAGGNLFVASTAPAHLDTRRD